MKLNPLERWFVNSPLRQATPKLKEVSRPFCR